ncbi:MAG: hypothetical protein ACOCV2_05805 [Persicimonas sp.]
MRYAIAISCLFVLALAPSMAAADAPRTVGAALRGYFSARSEDPAAQKLREAGFAYERMLVAESLPSGLSLMVEVELNRDDTSVRYPLKLKRASQADDAGWRIAWAPEEAYARSLASVENGRSLADIDGESWAELERLPALPIIVRSGGLITPFGEVAESPSDRVEDAEEIAPPDKLGEHIESWVGLVLEDAPGPAAVDLIVDQGVSWRQTTRAMMGPASLGLFRIYLVGAADGGLSAQSAVAPVRGEQDEAVTLVVGMYGSEDSEVYRVRVGGDLIDDGRDCEEGVEATFCADSDEGFRDGLEEVVLPALAEGDTDIAMITFGATGDISTAELAERRLAMADALGVPVDKTFVGFIGEAREEKVDENDGSDDARDEEGE